VVLCYICVLTVWSVIGLEQVLVRDSFTVKHGQIQTAEERFCIGAGTGLGQLYS
jgi:glucokinase